MLHVQSLSLVQFKNYPEQSFSFPNRITGVCGKNGVGKTNLLDALHYICFTKSYFARSDQVNVQHGREGFRVEAMLELDGGSEQAVCVLREAGKKEFSVNGRLYERFAAHIGRYPCVIVAPDDINIILNGSEERRRFIDTILCQLDATYLEDLMRYNKLLQQRNSLLKSWTETGRQDPALLEVLDEQLAEPGTRIFERRKTFLLAFLPLVQQLYHDIARQPEDVSLYYQSSLLQAPFPALLRVNRQADIGAARTTSGIHRDDVAFQLGRHPFKAIASQGQRKSLLFALKLAEMQVLREEKGFAPLLLLDDVFEKLDEERISNLLQRVCTENDGQVFITDTNCDRLNQHLAGITKDFGLIRL